MIRSRAAFKVCRFAEMQDAEGGAAGSNRQLYAEDEISEDIELGTRMHASGYKSVFVNEKLATGEVRTTVMYNPGGILLSDIQQIVLTNLEYFYRALVHAIERWCTNMLSKHHMCCRNGCYTDPREAGHDIPYDP